MSTEVSNIKPKRSAEISWMVLLVVTGLLVVALLLLSYIVLYTEGEVIQALFTLLVWIVGGLVFVGFVNRTFAFWAVVSLGGSLLLWQTFQIRKWAVIHEEVVEIVRFAETTKAQTGQYPADLKSYGFKNDWIKAHLCKLVSDETNGMVISYFMNDVSITYWYSSKTGFGYYPD